MKKKLLLLVPLFTLSLGIVSCSCSGNTSNEDSSETFTQNGITYLGVHHENTNLASVIGYDENLGKEIEIPSSVTSKYQYEVNMIAHKSFQYSNVEKVKVPETVTYIGYSSFSGCTLLKSIDLPSTLTSINEYTFLDCYALDNVTIPTSCESIGSSSFYGCSSLKNITFNSNLTYIGDYSFGECTSLESISIPENVYQIGEGAFAYCSSLSEVNLPDNLSIINSLAFYKCLTLENIFIPKSVTYIGSRVFEYTSTSLKILLESSQVPALFNSNFNCYRPYALGATRNTKSSDVFINDSTSKLNYVINNYLDSDNAYAIILSNNDVSQETVSIPQSVTYGDNKISKVTGIDDLAFFQNTSLKKLDLDNATSLTSIGNYSFSDCTSLESISNINKATSLKSIGNGAFYGCNSLSELNITLSSLESIGDYAFSSTSGVGTSGLKTVDLSSCSNLSYIGGSAFKNDYNLNSVILPDSTTSNNSPVSIIGSGCFNGCTKLESIKNLDEIENLILLGDTFNSCYSLGKDSSNPFILTSNISIITSTDFKNWGTVNNQYIKISKDAYTEDKESGIIYLNAVTKYGTSIKLYPSSEDGKYYYSDYFSNAIITLEPQDKTV